MNVAQSSINDVIGRVFVVHFVVIRLGVMKTDLQKLIEAEKREQCWEKKRKTFRCPECGGEIFGKVRDFLFARMPKGEVGTKCILSRGNQGGKSKP